MGSDAQLAWQDCHLCSKCVVAGHPDGKVRNPRNNTTMQSFGINRGDTSSTTNGRITGSDVTKSEDFFPCCPLCQSHARFDGSWQLTKFWQIMILVPQ